MNKDRVTGIIDEVVGSAKRRAGELTGDTKLQVEGMAQQVKGKVEGAWGMAKETVRDGIEGSEVSLEAHMRLGARNSAVAVDSRKCK